MPIDWGSPTVTISSTTRKKKTGGIDWESVRASIPEANTPSVVKPETKTVVPKTTFQKVEQTVVDTGKGIFHAAVDLGKSFVHNYTQPSDTTQQVEKLVLPPVGHGFQKFLSAPARTIDKAFIRTFAPILEPYGTDIGQIIATGGIAKQVGDGTLPQSALNDIAVLHKSNLQIIGDATQAALAISTPSFVKEAASGSGIAAKLITGLKTGAGGGAMFGGAQILSSGTHDRKEMAKILFQNIFAGSFLGTITGGATGLLSSLDRIKTEIKTPAVKEVVNVLHDELVTVAKNEPIQPVATTPHPGETQPQAIEPLPPIRSLVRLTKNNTTVEDLPVGTEIFHKDLGKLTIVDHKLVPTETGNLTKGVTLQDSLGHTEDLTLKDLYGAKKIKTELNLKSVQTTMDFTRPGQPVAIPSPQFEPVPVGELGKPNIGIESTVDSPNLTPETAKLPEPVQTPSEARIIKSEPIPKAGEARIAKAAQDINVELATKGFEALPDSELAKYNSTTKADQIRKISEIIKSGLETDMINGKIPIPDGVVHQALFETVKTKARAENNIGLLYDLSRSPILATERSIAAQELGAANLYRENSTADPVEAMRNINATRAKSTESKVAKNDTKLATKKGIERAKSEMKKAVSSKQTVADFIKSLEC